MVFQCNIVIILVTFVAFAMSLQEDCGESYYGHCDPGPGCTNRDPITLKQKCYKCHDGGYFPFPYECDGFTDCKNGYDEKYCYRNMAIP